MAQIHEAMIEITRDVQAIGKDSQNVTQGFKFRGIDAVMNELHPIFAKHGVVILPEVVEDRTEERQARNGGNLIYRILKTRFHFVAADGSEISSVILSEGMDSGDKAVNKALAVGLKYALTQMLLLPYDEVDPDSESHDVAPKGQVKQPQKAQEPAKTAPAAPKTAPKAQGGTKTAPPATKPVVEAPRAIETPKDDLDMGKPVDRPNMSPPKAADKGEKIVNVVNGKATEVKPPYGLPNTGSPIISAGTKAKIIAAFAKHNIAEQWLMTYSGFPVDQWTEDMKVYALADYKALEGGMKPIDIFGS